MILAFLYMYSLSIELSPQSPISRYVSRDFIRYLSFDKERRCYVYENPNGKREYYKGLLSKLEQLYYPHFREQANKSRRQHWRTRRQSSSAVLGKTVDNELQSFVMCGNVIQDNFHDMTKAIVAYLETEKGHEIVATQLPVFIHKWTRVTQADVITRDPVTMTLYMWEVKTGFPTAGYRKRGTFRYPYHCVPCTQYNIWELQRHFTHQALVESGLAIEASAVLQVYTDKAFGCVVKEIKAAKWCNAAPPPPH